jgi:hypothetical protein
MTPEQRRLRDRFASVPKALAGAALAAELAAGLAAGLAADPGPPGPAEWSPADIVRHLIAVDEEVWRPRLEQMATEDEPAWAWVEPDRWTDRPDASLDDLLVVFAAGRDSLVADLDLLDDRGWARTGTHVTFGRLDVAGLIARAVDHDEEHLGSLS